jgi:small subunit ribosomal protein S5
VRSLSRNRSEKSYKEKLSEWIPRTRLGRLVQEGKVSSLEEVFTEGKKVRESEIVDMLVPNLEEEVINVSLVQKQTDAGEKSRFKAIVAVGNQDGYIGLGSGKASQVRNAIEKAATDARLHLILIRRGCGSWECGCGQPHSLPFETIGKRGSVKIKIIPSPRGLGIVASEGGKVILRLAGIKDCWTKSYGSTRTVPSFAFAIFDALKKSYETITPKDWV